MNKTKENKRGQSKAPTKAQREQNGSLKKMMQTQ